MQVQSLSQEDPLESEMASHSSVLAWRIPWTEEPGVLQSMGCKESDMTKHSTTTNICDLEYIKKELYHNIMWLLEKKCIQGNA